YVINGYRDTNANLRTQLNRIIRKAGLAPWPKLFQNLRATRATELAADHPLHVVCAWIGNSTLVANKHYLQVTDADFDHAAKSGAAALQTRGQQPAASSRTNAQVPAEVLAGCDVVQDAAICCDSVREERVPPAGFEPATPGLGIRTEVLSIIVHLRILAS